MTPLIKLLENREEGWMLTRKLLDKSTNKVEILPTDDSASQQNLFLSQVSAKSALGSVILNTGGILIGDGWIRILGSGGNQMVRTIIAWNTGRIQLNKNNKPDVFLVADDAIGGIFALNGGGFGTDVGNIYYLPPDDLKWEPLDITYPQFLEFCASGEVAKFYSNLKWDSWESDLTKLSPDEVIDFFPPLWSKEGSIEKSIRNKIRIESYFERRMLQMNMNGEK
jgi:hypothetical protein